MLAEKSWKPEAVIRLLLSVFLCMVGSTLALAAATRFTGSAFEDSPWRAVIATLGFQGAALLFVHFFLHEHETNWSQAFGFTDRWKRAVLVGALAAMFFLPVGLGLQSLIVDWMEGHGYQPDTQQAVQALESAAGLLQRFALAGVAIVLAPVAEEVLFRGILYTAIKQLGYRQLALWGSSLLFAAIHWNLPTFVPLLVLALTLTLLYETTGNLLTSIAAHSLFNAANFAIFFAADYLRWLFPDSQ